MNELQRLPNLAALRAFEAAARHENFSRAAEEIHLTHGAISHQIRSLEEDLGVQLFTRNGKRIAITAEGQRFAATVRKSLTEISNAAMELKSSSIKRLTISALPSFAARWLAIRLGKFIDMHPDFEVTLQASAQIVDLNRGDIDVGIRFGKGSYPGVTLEFLMGDYYYPVVSPRYRDGNLPKTPQELEDNKLLRASDRDEPWTVWFAAAGLDLPEPTGGLVFSDSSMLIRSAAEGNGIAMARHVIAMQEIAAGELVRLFNVAVPCPHAYYLAYTRQGLQKPQVKAFRDWLLQEVTQFKQEIVWPEGGEPLQYRLAPSDGMTTALP